MQKEIKNEGTIDDLIQIIQDFKKEAEEKNLNNIRWSCELDWTGCWYEGDTATPMIELSAY